MLASIIPSQFHSEGFRLFDGLDVTKKAKFILSGITPGNVRALTIPDMDGVLVVEGSSPTFAGLDVGSLSGIILGTDGVFSAITNNSSNWNTAFGWGDHSGLYDATGTAASTMTTHLGNFAHGDIALNTTHRGLTSGNPHSVTPTELSLVIGTDVQAHDNGLDSVAGLVYAAASFIKMTGVDTFALRTIAETKTDLSLNLVENTAHSTDAHTMTIDGRDVSVDGTKLDGIEALADVTATHETSHALVLVDGDFGSAGLMNTDGAGTYSIKAIGTDVQAYHANLAAIAGGTWTGAASITTLGTIATGTWASTDVGIAYGGTGQSTAQLAINALTVVSGATNEYVLTKDTATGNAIWKTSTAGTTFISLTDVDPANYAGEAGNAVIVNAGEDGLEFGAAPGGGGMSYTNRGDPAARDFSQADLTHDNTWRDLDLSGIIGTGVKLVHLNYNILDNSVSTSISFRQNGNSNSHNISARPTQVSGVPIYGDGWVLCDANGVVEYRVSTTATAISITVRGWFS